MGIQVSQLKQRVPGHHLVLSQLKETVMESNFADMPKDLTILQLLDRAPNKGNILTDFIVISVADFLKDQNLLIRFNKKK
jgi:hypothetical protein